MSASPILLLLVGVVGQAPDVPNFIKQYSRVGTFYYLDPDPKIGPKMLKELLKKENLEHPFFVKRDDVPGLIGAQIGDIGAGKPEIVREYDSTFADASPTGRKVVIRALENAGDKETAKKVGEWIKDPKFADQKA